MNLNTPRPANTRAAFTMIELLTVIAIIAILAAILFPVFGAVREQARQGSTLSNMQAVYTGARLYYEDEGRYPSSLFGYAEIADNTLSPPFRPITPTDDPKFAIPMNAVAGTYGIGKDKDGKPTGAVRGFVYKEQVKDYVTFLSADDSVHDKMAVTQVYWPPKSPMGIKGKTAVDTSGGKYTLMTSSEPVMWSEGGKDGSCTLYPDADLPTGYDGNTPKMYYKMDAMDIGPMLWNDYPVIDPATNQPAYELHYTPDWTHKLGVTCDPAVQQMKYKNPPTDRTILTYVTDHVAFGHTNNVLVLLLSGTAKKMNAKDAFNQLPLGYKP